MKEKSEEIVRRIRVATLPWTAHVTEKKMFGGSCFLYNGKMCVGETKERLMVRVVPEKIDELMANPHVSPMDFTGKPLKEFIFVSEEGFDTEEKLQQWIELGIEHAQFKSK
ncbi:MAG: TfoX/Sxy family protein [Altibacter sp.]|uniref:TfoX/Sxy family protein n=1 Tax=Altibacter sp. TaxID=2024823 RepID=UPI001D4D8DC7|nr:TfoX/Sxy family protein [Altibacter sp.]MBZ0326629.1 TfoX/Sxy family protein [Altibacter sp.]